MTIGTVGANLLSNMAKLHIDSTRIRKIVISHSITGCAHPGIVSVVRKAHALS
jgi:metal-dependent hydrolase (beta-lactamase superfamily II)